MGHQLGDGIGLRVRNTPREEKEGVKDMMVGAGGSQREGGTSAGLKMEPTDIQDSRPGEQEDRWTGAGGHSVPGMQGECGPGGGQTGQ